MISLQELFGGLPEHKEPKEPEQPGWRFRQLVIAEQMTCCSNCGNRYPHPLGLMAFFTRAGTKYHRAAERWTAELRDVPTGARPTGIRLVKETKVAACGRCFGNRPDAHSHAHPAI